MKRVLIVAAHPDDELLGVGGTAAKHTLKGDDVFSIIMCEGESLRYHGKVGQIDAIQEAASILGIKKTYHIKLPDQRLDTYTLTEIITPLERVSEEIKPNIIYCQYGGDINMDHQILFQAANVAFRPLSTWIEDFYTFYTSSSTEWSYPRTFQPDMWVDISNTLDKKIEAFKKYHSEVQAYPHPRSSEALRNAAYYFGNQCLMNAAEVFMTIRRINRD